MEKVAAPSLSIKVWTVKSQTQGISVPVAPPSTSRPAPTLNLSLPGTGYLLPFHQPDPN